MHKISYGLRKGPDNLARPRGNQGTDGRWLSEVAAPLQPKVGFYPIPTGHPRADSELSELMKPASATSRYATTFLAPILGATDL